MVDAHRCWEIASLTMSAVSSIFRAHDGMHSEEERHFALDEKMADPTTGSLVILSGQETRSDPCISSVATAIMITSSNSSVKRSGTPNQFLGVLLHTMAISGLSRVRTELNPLLIVPSLAHHPIQTNRQVAEPWLPWRSCVLAASSGENTCCAIREDCAP